MNHIGAHIWYTSQLIVGPKIKERRLGDLINTVGFMLWELPRINDRNERHQCFIELFDNAVIHRNTLHEYSTMYERVMQKLDSATHRGYISSTLADHYKYLINCE